MQNRKHRTNRFGITLMEVLASIFVLSVGLLGVVAVIPFGNFQVSKAREAEYCASMLAAAKADIKVSGMTMPARWSSTFAGFNNSNIRCDRFFVLDPLGGTDFAGNEAKNVKTFYTNNFVGNDQSFWREFMRGQDELAYTTHEDYRPDFTEQGNVATSTGKFTWFCTFSIMLKDKDTYTGAIDNVPLGDIDTNITVDLLGCYNRVPGDAQERIMENIQFRDAYLNGARMTLIDSNADALRLTGTKYLFLTWPDASSHMQFNGSWCHIINASPAYEYGGKHAVDVILAPKGNAFPNTSWLKDSEVDNTENKNNIKALIIPGVLYHTTHTCSLE